MKIGSSVAQRIAQRQKRAAPFYCAMWHVANPANREDIQRNGLRASHKSRRVYLWADKQAAYFFATSYRGDVADIWEVDVIGLPLYVDDETCDMNRWGPEWPEGTFGYGFYTCQSIPPTRLRGPEEFR